MGNPLFLFALVAAAIPVALHLLSYRNPKPFKFSTLRFLREAIAKTRRSRRLTQILILAMRTLILALLALAFAQPRIRSLSFLPEGPRTLVIAIDGSASMRCRDLESSNFDKARVWALDLLGDLKGNDKVALWVTGLEKPKIIFPGISKHVLVRKAIKETECSYAQVDGGMELTRILREIAAAYPEQTVELHYFSDLQASTWDPSQVKDAGRIAKNNDIRLFLNATQAPTAGNSWLRQAQADVAPGLSEIAVRCRLGADENYSGSSVLRLRLQGSELAQKGVSIPSNADREERLQTTRSVEGDFVLGSVTLDSDPLAEDNSSYFAYRVQDNIPVLLVNGGPTPKGQRPDSYFLARALNPQRRKSPLIRAREIEWSELSGMDLSKYQATMVANPPAISSAVALKLELYAKSGGTVLLYPGSRGGLTKLQSFKPLQLLHVTDKRYTSTQKFKVITSDSASSLERRILGILKDKPSFSGSRRLILNPGEVDAQSYFQMDTDSPLLLRVPVERGEIFVSALPVDRMWSDWPMHPSFLLFHRLLCLENSSRQLKTEQIEVGDAAEIRITGDALELDVDLLTPAGRQERVTLKRRDKNQNFVIQHFRMPGHYRLTLQSGRSEVRYVAVNMPQKESLLAATSSGQLESQLTPASLNICDSFKEQKGILDNMTHGHALWPWLLLLAFILGIVEELFANVRSWGRDTPVALREFLNRRRA